MNHFLYGFHNADPKGFIQELKEKQIDTIIMGNPTEEIAALLADAGIDLYLCSGTLNLNPALTHDCQARDTDGTPTQWFRSGCPNDTALADFHLDRAAAKAATLPTLRGVVLDGARFASFASAEGKEAFFTCFCPRCMEKMTRYGYDAAAIRDMAAYLKQNRQLRPGDKAQFRAWLDFRQQCAKELFIRFAEKVHAVSKDLLTGAFVFAPSLGRFVGQTPASYGMLDLIFPMLYRHYPHPDGPACLGHEWAAFYELFGANAEALLQCAEVPQNLLPAQHSPRELLLHGFAPERIGAEVAASAGFLASPGASDRALSYQLWPILQIEDDRIAETAGFALANGAEGIGYFAYGQAEVPALSAITGR